MKNILLLLLLLPFLTFGQTEKGVNPVQTQNSKLETQNSTRAVVVGISDYQDAAIPDLRFADRDAEAFANFLRSPAGGSLDNDHLKVLTNQNATAGRVAEALDALVEQTKEGDQVVIYFSGHGDVERKTISQPGFLLCWDSPARVYMGGGTYSLAFLQEIVSTLSVQNKAKVVVVTDACHAGKLAGSQIGGAQLTSANLAKQYANEVKILSCQPSEFSLEGEQWGGGRGCFSYHLVEGLFGLADRNADGTVTVGEIDRYLEDNVTAEAAPQSQVPMLLGNKTERLASVSTAILAELKKAKSGGVPVFAATESRGFEDDVLAKTDSTIRGLYQAFKLAVQERRFFTSSEKVGKVQYLADIQPVADELYVQLSGVEALAPLQGIMKRNYAAALQDDAQQTLNNWLKTSQEPAFRANGNTPSPSKVFTEKVRSYPRCLERAAELLGEKHYMYAPLMARKYFFEGYLLANANKYPNTKLGEQALGVFRQSFGWQPEQPQVYWQMSKVFGNNLQQPDSLLYYTLRAVELHPNWVLPLADAALLLTRNYKQPDQARSLLEQASRIDTNSTEVLRSWAILHLSEKNYNEAERLLKKAIALNSMSTNNWNALGYLYLKTRRFKEAVLPFNNAIAADSSNYSAWVNLGEVYLSTRRYPEAEAVYKKSIARDSMDPSSWNNLGMLYLENGRYTDSELILKKSIALDSAVGIFWNNLGYLYNRTKRYTEAKPAFEKAIALDSTDARFWNNLGQLYFWTNRMAEAEPAFKKAVLLDSTNVTQWYNLGYFYTENLRSNEAERALKKTVELDSTFTSPLNSLGILYHRTNRYAEAEQVYKKVIALDSTNVFFWIGLGGVYLSTRQYAEAVPVFKKVISLDSTNASPWTSLGFSYLNLGRYPEAEAALTKAISLDSAFANARKHLGMVCFKTKRPDEARQNFFKALELNPNYAGALLGMAYLLAAEGKTEEAIGYVEQAIGKGSTFEQLEKDTDLAPLRTLPEWKALMKKYFPDKVKD